MIVNSGDIERENRKVFADKAAPVTARYVVVRQNYGRSRSASDPYAVAVNDGQTFLYEHSAAGMRIGLPAAPLDSKEGCHCQGFQINAPFPPATSGTPVFLPTHDTDRR